MTPAPAAHGPRRLAAALLVLAVAAGQAATAQIGGRPGAYGRLGFGARGMGMGNAMAAVAHGQVVGYYNPALLPWTGQRHAAASMGVMSVDRRLNFLSFSTPLPPHAGLSVGIINSGVTDIDGRDSDGEPTGPLQTSENQALLGFGLRLPFGLSLGFNAKLLYYHLYTDLTSTTVGIDLGAYYAFLPELGVGVTVRDINSKYKWDTSKLLGQQGLSTVDDLPRLYTVGAMYLLPDSLATITAEIEASGASTLAARVGAEVPLVSQLTLRAGLDRIDLKQSGAGLRPSFGFTARTRLDGLTPEISYAYVIEPFAPSGLHMITVGATF